MQNVNRDEQINFSSELAASIALGANYLRNYCQGNGRFIYRVNTNPKVRYADKYNILRHGGTIYALASAQTLQPDLDLSSTITVAAQFLVQRAISEFPDDDSMSAVWSRLEFYETENEVAKLGGAGLGLVALLSTEALYPNQCSHEAYEKLGRFIAYMQKPNGSFYAQTKPKKNGFLSKTSLYYPGEAALGLIMLYELTKNEEWYRCALSGLSYLAKVRKGKADVPMDHWALIATARLFENGKYLTEAQRAMLIEHAKQICQVIIARRQAFSKDMVIAGALDRNGLTTPTATSLEGLLAALTFLSKAEANLCDTIKEAIGEGVRFLMRSQIQEGPFAGGIPRAITTLPGKQTSELKKFNRRATEIRIDYVQHALSAMINYHYLLESN